MWEYKLFRREHTNLTPIQRELDSLGKEGWEMVSSFLDGISFVFIMKRKLNLSEEEMKEFQ